MRTRVQNFLAIVLGSLGLIGITDCGNYENGNESASKHLELEDSQTYFYYSGARPALRTPHAHTVHKYIWDGTRVNPNPNTDWAAAEGGHTYRYYYDAVATDDYIETYDTMYFDANPGPNEEGQELNNFLITLRLSADGRIGGGLKGTGHNQIRILRFNDDGTSSWQLAHNTGFFGNYRTYTINSEQLVDANSDVSHYITAAGRVTVQVFTKQYGWWQPIPFWFPAYWSPGIRVTMDLATIELEYKNDWPIRLDSPKAEKSYYGSKSQGGIKIEYKKAANTPELQEIFYIVNPSEEGTAEALPENKTIPLHESGDYEIQLLGIDESGNEYYSQIVPFTFTNGQINPAVQWTSHVDGDYVIFGIEDNDNVFDVEYRYLPEFADEVKLYLNEDEIGQLSPEADTIDLTVRKETFLDWRNVTATLRAYKDGNFVEEDAVEVVFVKATSEDNEVMEEGTEYLGNVLYLILHDPSGDNSYSGYTESSAISIGVGATITAGIGYSTEVGVEAIPVLFDHSGSSKLELFFETEIGFDCRYEVVDTLSLSSNVINFDADYIGPGYGDAYWGETWDLNWQLIATSYVLGDGTKVYVKPRLEYGIVRSSESYLSDSQAPEAWRAMNTVLNGYDNVTWLDMDQRFSGGLPWEAKHEVTTTQTQSISVTFGLTYETRSKFQIANLYLESALTLNLGTRIYAESSQSQSIETSYYIEDGDGADTLVMDIGIDNRFGTYVFRTKPGTNTSNPQEHDIADEEI